jgi:hypothetical protein
LYFVTSLICWDPSGSVVDSKVLPMMTAMGSLVLPWRARAKGARLDDDEGGGMLALMMVILQMLLMCFDGSRFSYCCGCTCLLACLLAFVSIYAVSESIADEMLGG